MHLLCTDTYREANKWFSSVEAEISESDSQNFYKALKLTPFPFLPCKSGDISTLYPDIFDLIFVLGGRSLGHAIGLTMHLYLLAAIATFPMKLSMADKLRIRAFLFKIKNGRCLVANSGADEVNRSQSSVGSTTHAQWAGDRYIVEGEKSLVSLATVADIIFFSAQTDDGMLRGFYSPLKGNNEVELISKPFGSLLESSGTRGVRFNSAHLAPEACLGGNYHATQDSAFQFQRTWFQSIITAAYLGAAHTALTEAANFAWKMKPGGDQFLAQSDGVITDLGRLSILLKGAVASAEYAGNSLYTACTSPAKEKPERIQDALAAATMAKYQGTNAAEYIVLTVRRFIGTRAMMPGHRIYNISRDIGFGPMHPQIGAVTEREFGAGLLNGARPASVGQNQVDTEFMSLLGQR